MLRLESALVQANRTSVEYVYRIVVLAGTGFTCPVKVGKGMNLSCRCKFKTEQGKQEYDANEFFHAAFSFIKIKSLCQYANNVLYTIGGVSGGIITHNIVTNNYYLHVIAVSNSTISYNVFFRCVGGATNNGFCNGGGNQGTDNMYPNANNNYAQFDKDGNLIYYRDSNNVSDDKKYNGKRFA